MKECFQKGRQELDGLEAEETREGEEIEGGLITQLAFEVLKSIVEKKNSTIATSVELKGQRGKVRIASAFSW